MINFAMQCLRHGGKNHCDIKEFADLHMCTKKTLYTAGVKENVTLRHRERGGKLNFTQVAYSTDCVREAANILEIPMAEAIGRIQGVKDGFAIIYREARKPIRKPAKIVAREVLSM